MSSKINIEQLEEYLKQAGLENGKLEEVLSPIKELNNQRRYGLVWEEPDNSTYGTDSAEQELLRNFPFLKEVNEHRIFNGEQHPDHLLIEGDNLHALKTMQYTHKNKINVIYIDPPYNTGNTDFVYNDKYVDNEDSWRHSKWLSFMNKRLRLARELMSDDGVIFISIDDNEQAQLKMLCDQVFGEQNFIENMIWIKNAGNNNSILSSTKHEYLVCYAKKKNNLDSSFFNIKKRGYDEVVKIIEEGASNETSPKIVQKELREFYNKNKTNITKGILQYKYVDEKYSVFRVSDLGNPSNTALNNPDYNYTLTNPLNGEKLNMPKRGWLYKKEDMIQKILNNEIYLDSKVPGLKRYLADVKEQNTSSVIPNYDNGITELKDVFTTNNIVFNNPKPTSLIRYLIELHPNPNALILDFFAGSGTTAHAVMELNKEDGGNRQAIVITNNEINSSEEEALLVEKGFVEPFTGTRRGTKKHGEWLEKVNEFKQTPEYLEFIETDEYKDLGIARAVTEQRINKVINGYTTRGGKDEEGLDNNNFYHFEVVLEPDLLDMDLNTYVLVNKTKDIIRIKEGVYTTEEDISTEITPAVKLVNEDKEVIVVLSVRVTESDIEQLINNFDVSEKEHVIYTSYTGFEYGINNIRFEELPKELLQAIKHDDNN